MHINTALTALRFFGAPAFLVYNRFYFIRRTRHSFGVQRKWLLFGMSGDGDVDHEGFVVICLRQR